MNEGRLENFSMSVIVDDKIMNTWTDFVIVLFGLVI